MTSDKDLKEIKDIMSKTLDLELRKRFESEQLRARHMNELLVAADPLTVVLLPVPSLKGTFLPAGWVEVDGKPYLSSIVSILHFDSDNLNIMIAHYELLPQDVDIDIVTRRRILHNFLTSTRPKRFHEVPEGYSRLQQAMYDDAARERMEAFEAKQRERHGPIRR